MSPPIVDLTALLDQTYASVQSKVPLELQRPVVGIVCGSGLSTLAEKSLRNRVDVRLSSASKSSCIIESEPRS